MPITSITIENFKGIGKEVTVPLRPITLFFGKNSAGKSSILHAMLYAYDVLKTGSSDIDRISLGGDSIDLGGFKSLVHGHDQENVMTIGFEFDMANRRADEVYPIAEFIENLQGSQVDLSDMGCEIETAKVVLSIAEPGRDIVGYKLHINGLYFGEIYENGNVDLWGGKYIVRINLVHPLIRWPVEDDELEESSIGPVDAYIGDLTNGMQKYYIDGAAVEYPEDAQLTYAGTDIQTEFFRDTSEFVDGTLRRNLYSWNSPVDDRKLMCSQVIGVSKDSGRLEYHSLSFIDNPHMDGFSPWTKDDKGHWICEVKTKSWYDNPASALGIASAVPAQHECIRITPVVSEIDEDDPEAQRRKDFAERLITRIMVAPVEALKDELSRTRYIGPIREMPPRDMVAPLVHHPSDWADGLAGWYTLLRAEPPESGTSDDLVATVERMVTEDLNLGHRIVRRDVLEFDTNGPALDMIRLLPAAIQLEETDQTMLQEFIDYLNEIEPSPRLELWDQESGEPVACCDVGVGVSQVIPVLVGALAGYEGGGRRGVFAVEQPELHLHPAAQCGLGDVFIRAMKKNTAPMLIETHSEHLLLRLLRRIAETAEGELEDKDAALDREKLSALFVRSTEAGTEIIPLNVSEDGDIVTRLPEGFFDERMGELF